MIFIIIIWGFFWGGGKKGDAFVLRGREGDRVLVKGFW